MSFNAHILFFFFDWFEADGEDDSVVTDGFH